MVFSSIEFLLGFLPVFLFLYYITPNTYKNITLFGGSLIFYAYGEPIFVLLLLASMLINYFFGRLLSPKAQRKEAVRKACFICMMVLNVGILSAFKIAPEEFGLPLGVSFYTYQIMSYLIDVYRGRIGAETSFIRLGTYICMFPQLVAGPIVNYSQVSEQIKAPDICLKNVDKGLKTFVWGLCFKVLMADRLALLWHEISTIGYVSIVAPLAWMGAISYSMQIYFDFYGYSLMAIGLANMLGFYLPENFDLPYASRSIREFYRRWHMTLGKWFTDYVYIPLGGNRKGLKRTVFNLFVVWILTSLWHGASFNFLIWGMVICFFIVAEKLLSSYQEKKGKQERKGALVAIAKHIYVCLVIMLTWVCFAITDLKELGIYLGRMFGVIESVSGSMDVFYDKLSRYGLLMAVGIFLCTPGAKKLYEKGKDTLPGMFVLTVLFWLSVWYILTMGNNPFMYFRF